MPEKFRNQTNSDSRQQSSFIEMLAFLFLEGACRINTDSCIEQRLKIPGQDVNKVIYFVYRGH
jgi:hypothetical protein